MNNKRTFFQYVIPSVLSFALSGVYAIVDGFFVGNSIGDAGLSTINIAYPVTAVLQAVGTGIGMGGAVKYSILKAEGKEEKAREHIAGALWLMIFFSLVLTATVLLTSARILSALGASGELLTLGNEYIKVIAVGTVLQVFGTGLVPNVSLVLINRFSVSYGGQEAVAIYACISYVICIVYLVLQGVGDGSQPLMSQFYGAGDEKSLKQTKTMAYKFALALAVIGVIMLYLFRGKIGLLFGSSVEVNTGILTVMPIFLVSLPFDAVTRITTAAFYATEKSALSYILTFAEPIFMLILMLILPPLLGGQIMIWWSAVLAKIMTAGISVGLSAKFSK